VAAASVGEGPGDVGASSCGSAAGAHPTNTETPTTAHSRASPFMDLPLLFDGHLMSGGAFDCKGSGPRSLRSYPHPAKEVVLPLIGRRTSGPAQRYNSAPATELCVRGPLPR